MRFVKILLGAASMLGFVFASGAYADPPSVAGRLSYLSGPVSFASGDAPDEWVAAELNRPVTTGDRLWADGNALAEMRVGSLAMRMSESTAVDILALEDRALQLRVPQGNVQLRVRQLPSDRLIEIATPSASVVVRRPGSYRISVDPSGALIAVARAGGEAEVYTADSSVVVRDNEEASVADGRVEMYGAPAFDEFDRWAENRDARDARIAAARYVPTEMTGYEDLDRYGQWRTVDAYGAVWFPTGMAQDWAPYRDGHWVWISPWGWTWVDGAPWGFAPYHYGRWVWLDNAWGWAPGRIVERPVYSPALVAFIGGAGFAASVGLGSAAVGWVPLGWNEPYIPWYTASPAYVRNVNVAYVRNVANITNITNIRYVNRAVPSAVTVISRENFVAARPVERTAIRVPWQVAATAPVTRTPPVAEPARTSFVRSQPGPRPPAQVASRQAVVVNAPPAVRREGTRQTPPVAAAEQRPAVRVIERQQRVNVPVAPSAEARRPQSQAPRVMAPAEQPRAPQTVQEQQAREQRGERERELQRKQEEQQKAQAQQQADQLERERRQAEQQKAQQQQRAQQEQQRQAAEQQQRAREQEARQQQQAAEQRAREQQAEQQRAREQQAREQQVRQQQELRQRQAEQQRAQEQQQRAAQQRAREEQQRAQQEQLRAQQAQQQAQQRAREQEARQQAQAQRQQQAAQEQRAREQAQHQQQQAAQAREPRQAAGEKGREAPAEKGEKGRRPNQD